MLKVLRNPKTPPERRDRVAGMAAPAEQRRERARRAILEAFAERPPRVVEGEYRVVAGNEVPVAQAKDEASDER